MKQKHLSLEQRERIEKGIRNGEKLIDISNAIDKDPTTISKEVKRSRSEVVPTTLSKFTSYCHKCIHSSDCRLQKVCNNINCTQLCKSCNKVDPTTKCDNFLLKKCKRICRFPYVCNGCKSRLKCRLTKYEYIPISAEDKYKRTLVESRRGFNLSIEEYDSINKVIKEGTDKGQSINHIISNNPKLNISVKTAYNYANSGKFSFKKEDLPYYVNGLLKKRKMKIPKDYVYPENKNISRKGREYYDYLVYVDENNIIYHAELDCVGITKDYKGALFTFIVPKWSFLLLFKVEIKDTQHINDCINYIYEQVGFDKFFKYFGVTLADRGSEFNDTEGIEIDMEEGVRRTHLFYCDSGQSTQKPFVERINKEIRRFVFKGQSVEKITQEDCNFIASSINSISISSLDNKTAYDFAFRFLGKNVLDKLHIKKIPPNELTIKNIDLIKHEKKTK